MWAHVVALFIALNLTQDSQLQGVRSIPIPDREHGYQNLQTEVLGSAKQLEALLERVAEQDGWNQKKAFVRAMKRAEIDFAGEVLVLIQHTERSGGVRIGLETEAGEEQTLSFRIYREVPEIGTADMAYYAFALIVPRERVKKVEVWKQEESLQIPPDSGS